MLKTFLAALPLLLGAAGTHAQAAKPVQVLLTTSEGNIKLELDAAKAPVTVTNFVEYVKAGHYDNTIFHRVIDGFMIQGGGFTADMAQKPVRKPIALESSNGLKNTRGTVAMARTSDPNSATAQFFINVVDNPGLDRPNPDGHGYAVFGKVTEGMDVVDKIKAAATTQNNGHRNVPAKPIVIRSAKIAG
jgi:peptidyl-prolyl cis-trans isomerase A (cyclophilin A)